MCLALLPQKDLVAQCEIQQRTDPNYVPSECLVYFVRASRTDKIDIHFEKLYKVLVRRVLRCLPNSERPDGRTTSLASTLIQEKVFGIFVEMLANDRNTYNEKLDYYEINFEGALKSLRISAQRQVWREENRSTSLYDEETGELTTAVERAAGKFDPFNTSVFSDQDYRFRLYKAIDALPLEQRRIIEMIQKGIPIHSLDPDIVTISRSLNKSEKTIRTYRNKAYAALRAALTEGDNL